MKGLDTVDWREFGAVIYLPAYVHTYLYLMN